MHNILPWKEWLPCEQFSKYTPYAPNIDGRSVLQKSMPDSEICDAIKLVKQAETSIPHHVHIVQVIRSQFCRLNLHVKHASMFIIHILMKGALISGVEGDYLSFGNSWEEKHAYYN